MRTLTRHGVLYARKPRTRNLLAALKRKCHIQLTPTAILIDGDAWPRTSCIVNQEFILNFETKQEIRW